MRIVGCLLFFGLALAQDELVIVHPSEQVFAGSLWVEFETSVGESELVGLELLVNGESVHYFDQGPFRVKVDLSTFAEGSIVIKGVLTTFSGREFTATKMGRNIARFHSEDVLYVRVPVLVDHRGNRPVDPLRIEDFRLYEDGVEQKPSVLYTQTQPIDIVIVIDTSGSMQSKMSVIKKSLNTFFDLMHRGDRVQLIGFNHQVYPICGFESDVGALKYRVRTLVASGETNLNAAMWSGVRAATRAPGRRAVLIFTDGRQELRNKKRLARLSKSVDDALILSRKEGIPVYTIGVGSEIEPMVLSNLSQQTGGESFILSKRKDIVGAFESIANRLGDQYLLCYYSHSEKTGIHDMEVTVPGWDEIVLRYPLQLYFR